MSQDQELLSLFNNVRKMPFPELGKSVGEFALYDGLVMGYISSVIAGKSPQGSIPDPDDESFRYFKQLNEKSFLMASEKEFCDYFCELLALVKMASGH